MSTQAPLTCVKFTITVERRTLPGGKASGNSTTRPPRMASEQIARISAGRAVSASRRWTSVPSDSRWSVWLTGFVRYRCAGTGGVDNQLLGRVTLRRQPSHSPVISRGSDGHTVKLGDSIAEVQ